LDEAVWDEKMVRQLEEIPQDFVNGEIPSRCWAQSGRFRGVERLDRFEEEGEFVSIDSESNMLVVILVVEKYLPVLPLSHIMLSKVLESRIDGLVGTKELAVPEFKD
jgi:hypothetical protein